MDSAERIFFTSLADQGSWDPVSPLSVYDAYINADDDDGNLANGTPHAAAIFAAFDLEPGRGYALVPATGAPVTVSIVGSHDDNFAHNKVTSPTTMPAQVLPLTARVKKS